MNVDPHSSGCGMVFPIDALSDLSSVKSALELPNPHPKQGDADSAIADSANEGARRSIPLLWLEK